MCVSTPLGLNFLSLDWCLQSLFPAALKNTFHFNVAAAHKVVCHLIMTKQTQRHFPVNCVYVREGSLDGARADRVLVRSQTCWKFEVAICHRRGDGVMTPQRKHTETYIQTHEIWCWCFSKGIYHCSQNRCTQMTSTQQMHFCRGRLTSPREGLI